MSPIEKPVLKTEPYTLEIIGNPISSFESGIDAGSTCVIWGIEGI
jgi:hypothetical protein